VSRSRHELGLDAQDLRLVELTHRRFVRNGALLDSRERERIQEIDLELSRLRAEFTRNLARATEAFEYHTEDETELTGLPDAVLEVAAHNARDRNRQGGWTLTLQMPWVSQVVKYASDRSLRERMARAWGAIAYGGEFDNSETVKGIASLSHERARLLGYPSHAAHQLEERMAGSPESVQRFRDRLYQVALPAARADLVEVRRTARELDGIDELRPWDVSYYVEKLKQAKFDFDGELLRPYLRTEDVVAGVIDLLGELFGLRFAAGGDIPVYHDDVRGYEVADEDGAFLGLLYLDLLSRKGKMGGAWKSCYRCQGSHQQRDQRPLVSVTANLAPSTPTRPSLLSIREVKTLFHEMGHAVHALLSRARYRSLNSCHVYRDFVELPSQLMENWVTEKEVLDRFARHHESGASIPAALIDALKRSEGFLAGWELLGGLRMIDLDWAWFARDPSGVTDIGAYENEVTSATRLLEPTPGTNASVSFRHLFGGGYAAGFYGYRWAETLSADAFELFTESRIVDPEVATRFRRELLERGNTKDPLTLYREFRGHDPDPDAMLRSMKLLPALAGRETRP